MKLNTNTEIQRASNSQADGNRNMRRAVAPPKPDKPAADIFRLAEHLVTRSTADE